MYFFVVWQEAEKVTHGGKHVTFGGKEGDRNSDSEQWYVPFIHV